MPSSSSHWSGRIISYVLILACHVASYDQWPCIIVAFLFTVCWSLTVMTNMHSMVHGQDCTGCPRLSALCFYQAICPMLTPTWLFALFSYLPGCPHYAYTRLSPLRLYLAVPTTLIPGCPHYAYTWLFALCYIHVWMDQEPTMHI